MERYATAIAAPFDSSKCEKIAKSYFMGRSTAPKQATNPLTKFGSLAG